MRLEKNVYKIFSMFSMKWKQERVLDNFFHPTHEYKSCSFRIDISTYSYLIESHCCLTCCQSLIMKYNWNSDDSFEFSRKFLYSFSMNWHSSIDIIWHADHESSNLFILYNSGKDVCKFICWHSTQRKCKPLYWVGNSSFLCTIIKRQSRRESHIIFQLFVLVR